jgi:hypothetical protein
LGDEKNGKFTGDEGFDERTVSPEMSLISIPERGISIEKELAEIEKNVEFFNRVKIIALKMTKPSDWVDQGATVYLMDRGAENIAIAFGVDISDVQLRMEWAEDEKGRYYSFIASGKAYAKKLGRYVEDIGVCSQRDKFFGKIGDKYKEIAEVDMANIRRKAVTNLYSRLIKRVIGLMGVTMEDLRAAGMDTAKIQKVDYKGGSQRAEISEDGKALRTKLGNMLLLMANNDKPAAKKLLEKYSSWTDKDGKEHKAEDLAKMSEKWIASTYGKAKADFEKTSGGPTDQDREPGAEG